MNHFMSDQILIQNTKNKHVTPQQTHPKILPTTTQSTKLLTKNNHSKTSCHT